MMRGRSLWSIVGVMLLVGSGAAVQAKEKNHNHLLRGDYAFSGEATCLVSFTGFSANLVPKSPGRFPIVISFSIQGVRTFHGDGTGQVVARFVSISHPFALPTTTPVFNRGGANSGGIEATFTYEVAPDRTFTVETASVTGTFDSGTRNGQTFSVTHIPVFSGLISKDHRTLTVAHEEPGVEMHTFSNDDVDHRICHRSRILLELKGGHHDDD